jgi:uncharacterized protein (TIGR03435 family)
MNGLFGRWAVFAVLALGVCAGSVGSMEGQAPVEAVAMASPTFEVTTVKPNKTGGLDASSQMQGGVFRATNVTVKRTMQYQAYGISRERIVDGPKWLDSERFDIEAKLDSDDAARLSKMDREHRRATLQPMFQQLLADRFKLAVHWETREMPVYELRVDKKGSLLTPAKSTETGSGTEAEDDSILATNVTLDEFAQTLTQELQRELGRVVVDKTGLSGRFDVKLKWTPEDGVAEPSDAAADAPPAILTAMQEQLGLRLESAKAQVKVLVIDHVEMPTEN